MALLVVRGSRSGALSQSSEGRGRGRCRGRCRPRRRSSEDDEEEEEEAEAAYKKGEEEEEEEDQQQHGDVVPSPESSIIFIFVCKGGTGQEKKIEGHVIIAKVARTLNDDGRTNQSIGESSAILFITGGVAIYYLFIYIYTHTYC